MSDEKDQLIDEFAAALCECFDAAIPQAQSFPGYFREKAEYAAKVLPEHLRGLNRLLAYSCQDRANLAIAFAGWIERQITDMVVENPASEQTDS